MLTLPRHLALWLTTGLMSALLSGCGGAGGGTDVIPTNLPVPNATLSTTQTSEGNSGTTNLTVTLTLDQPAPRDLSVAWMTVDGTALAGSDYQAASGVATLLAGQTSQSLSIAITGDSRYELDENFYVHLSNAQGFSLTQTRVEATILNDDPLLIQVAPQAQLEGLSGSSLMRFTVSLSQPLPAPMVLNYATRNLTASAGSDYLARSGTLSFSPLVTSQTIDITINGDQSVELDETFQLDISGPANLEVVNASTTGTLLNDDFAALSISPAGVNEGDVGTTILPFTVRLDRAVPGSVSADFTTSDGSAIAGSDYLARSGTLTFNPGVSSMTINVQVIADLLAENSETLTLTLSNPQGATLAAASASAIGTIGNDDRPRVSATVAPSAPEGDIGSSTLAFNIQLDQPALESVSLSYATVDQSASAGSDYTPVNGKLTFLPGETGKSINVTLLADTLVELDESFALSLSNPIGALITTPLLSYTILDDDQLTLSVADGAVVEGDSGTTTLDFVVTLDQVCVAPVSVDFTTADGSATLLDGDYLTSSGTLLFNPGEQSKSISVTINGDARYETSETLGLLLSNPVGTLPGRMQAVGQILGDDLPQLSVAPVSQPEGNAAGNLLFNVVLSQAALEPISVNYTTADLNATAGSDYQATTGTLNFAIGDTALPLSVAIIGDTQVEPDEQFELQLSGAVGAVLAAPSTTATLSNDDSALVSVADASVAEGDLGPATLSFLVNLDQPALAPVSVDYSSGDISALSGSDYSALSGSLLFNPGETQKQVDLQISGDVDVERDEQLSLTLSNPIGALPGRMLATGTISNDDFATLTIAPVTQAEGNAPGALVSFILQLDRPTVDPVSFAFATVNGTATAGNDYVGVNNVMQFNPGELTKQVDIPIIGDLLVEADEQFSLQLGNIIGAQPTQLSAVATLQNDDQPTLSVANVQVVEGNSGTPLLTFVLRLDQAPLQPVSFDYATSDQSATAGSDYTALNGTLSFSPGVAVQNLNIPIMADTLIERDESLLLSLSNPLGVTIATPQVIGTLQNDDIARISVGDMQLLEADVGTAPLSFTVSLDQAALDPVSVDFATVDASAVAGSDYTALTGNLQFNPGQLQQQVVITTSGDTLPELDEQFQLALSNPLGALIATPFAVGTLSNNDFSQIDIANAQQVEGDLPGGALRFNLTLDQPSPVPVSVDYLSSDATAIAGSDYSATSGTLVFNPGQTALPLDVPLIGDTVVERDESFNLTLSNPQAASIITTQVSGTLLNDDSAILSVADVSAVEGSVGPSSITFTVSLDRPALDPVSVSYATLDIDALAGSDYSATTGTLNFAPGTLSQQVVVPLTADTVVEHNETFSLQLSALSGAVPGQLSAVATLLNDDLPVLSVTAPSQSEGSVGNGLYRFTLDLDQAAADPVSVSYTTLNGTALDGSDYSGVAGTLTFTTGQQTLAIDVTVMGDTLVEPDENFSLMLANPQGLQLAAPSAIATLLNDDQPTVNITGASVNEGQLGTTPLEFSVTLDQAPLAPLSIDYATANGSATSGSDYSATSGTLNFAIGERVKLISVPVLADLLVEADEGFTLSLSNPQGVNLGLTTQATGIILNDDALQVRVLQGANVTEGNAGTTLMPFTISLSEPATTPVSVDYLTSNGTAISGSDYLAASGTLNFAIGDLIKTVLVSVLGDTVAELDEGFTLTLTAATGANIANAVGNATITNDDLPVVSIADVMVTEGAVGTTQQVGLVVTLDQPGAAPVTLDYSTLDGSATAGSDYVASSGVLEFLPGTTSLPITLTVNGDGLVEADEQLSLTLSNIQGALVGIGSARVTINNDDTAVLSIADAQILEGNAGSTQLDFTVSLDQPALTPVSFDYASSDLSATAGSDYTAIALTPASIPAGSTTLTLSVMLSGDTLVERDEQFSLTLSNQTGALPGVMSATGTLLNDDTAVLSIAPASLYEGDLGSTALTFSVSLDQASLDPVTVDFASSDASALAASDYTATSGSLSFLPGETLKTISVPVTGDTLYEADEQFTLTLSNLLGADPGPQSVQGTINNDDPPALSLSDAQVVEGSAGISQLSFLFTLEGPAHIATSIDYTTRDLSATAGSDYTATSGTLSFPVGVTSNTLLVDVQGDLLVEGDETLAIDLTAPVGLTPTRLSATGTLFTDERFNTLNDTGINWGGVSPTGNNPDCSGETPTAQDCSFGRDTLYPNAEDGRVGFSFTKLDSSGASLPASASVWSCVRDNVTGLVWEVKQGGNGVIGDEGLHDADDLYNWYDSNPLTNGGQTGFTEVPGASCSGYDVTLASSSCNTEAYVARVNGAALCGASDWRMPTMAELQSLTDLGLGDPAIETLWFPSTRSGVYWSASAAVSNSNNAWGLDFSTAIDSGILSRLIGRSVRLVRSAP